LRVERARERIASGAEDVPMTTELSRLFDEYAAYHRHPLNKLCHYVGIPMIVVTAIGLLSRVSLVVAAVIAVLVVLYDLRLSVKLTVPFAALILVSFAISRYIPVSALWAGFIVGWILQFVGHIVYEKKSPAFFTNLRQLLVGPLWIIGTLGAPRSTPLEAPGKAPLEG
jgi:uncharacterized membrane protein YGL010W